MHAPASTERRERKRQQTLDHLADTAWALFEAEGYEQVTMEQIADRADVAKATLYKHFPVKEALLRHRFHRELAAQVPALVEKLAKLPTAAARLRGFLAACATWAEAHRRYLLPYVRFRLGEAGAAGPRERSGMDRILAHHVADGQARGEFRADMPTARLAGHLEFLYLGVLLRWLMEDGPPLSATMDQMADFALTGLAAAHGRPPLP